MTFTPLNPTAAIRTIVSMAFGANPDGNPASWTWTDVSAYVRGAVTITKGRGDYARTADATRISFTLNNTDGRFTPGNPLSPYWPNVVRNVPVRVQLTGFGDPLVAPYERATAFVDQWPITPNAGVIDVISQVTASGKLRRLQIGSKPLRSPLYRTISATSGLVAYWPMEDGSRAAAAAQVVTGQAVMQPVGTAPVFGATGPAGAAGAVDVTNGGFLSAPVVGGSASAWSVEFSMMLATSADPGTGALQRFVQVVTGGTESSWQLGHSISGGPSLLVYQPDATNDLFLNATGAQYDGAWHNYVFTAAQSGSDIAVALYVDDVSVATGTITGATLGAVTRVTLPAATANYLASGQGSITSVAVYNGAITPGHAGAVGGWVGESATGRITRLCAEQGVRVTVTAGTYGSVQAMGPQPVATFVGILHDAESTDQGFLHDGGPNGDLAYASNSTRYNATVAAALDYRLGHLGDSFAGIFDDQRLVNDSEASRPSGATSEYAVASSEGDYDEGRTYNVAADSQLSGIAQSRVAVGTSDDMRYPVVDLDMIRSPALAQQAVAIVPGSRVTVAGLPTPPYPPGTVDQFVEQVTEVIDARTWRMLLTCSPATPFRAAVIESTTTPWVVDAGDSALNAGITSTATSIAIKTTAGPLWSTAGGDYPVDVLCDGEVMRVTAMSGAASPQTATVTRSINGIVKAHSANAVVSLYRPATIAL